MIVEFTGLRYWSLAWTGCGFFMLRMTGNGELASFSGLTERPLSTLCGNSVGTLPRRDPNYLLRRGEEMTPASAAVIDTRLPQPRRATSTCGAPNLTRHRSSCNRLSRKQMKPRLPIYPPRRDAKEFPLSSCPTMERNRHSHAAKAKPLIQQPRLPSHNARRASAFSARRSADLRKPARMHSHPRGWDRAPCVRGRFRAFASMRFREVDRRRGFLWLGMGRGLVGSIKKPA
jgi:hypothetical protein